MINRLQSQDAYIQTKTLRLHYVEWGDSTAQSLILLHGLQDCARSWDIFASKMCMNYRVLALDHRGHGDSEWASPGNYRLKDYISDVKALVEELKLRRVIVLGHSAGGRNAFAYAVTNPEVVESLIIVDIDPDEVNLSSQSMFARYQRELDEWPSLEAVVERLRMRQPESTEEMLTHQAVNMTKQLPAGRRAWKRDRNLLHCYERPDLWDVWSRVKCPTLIVRGRQSDLLTHEVAVKMREANSAVRLVELEGGGHWFYQESPGAFEATVRWFLEQEETSMSSRSCTVNPI